LTKTCFSPAAEQVIRCSRTHEDALRSQTQRKAYCVVSKRSPIIRYYSFDG